MAIAIIVLLGFLVLAVLPQFWVKRVIEAHSGHRSDFPGSGGKFARHLLDEMKLTHVTVEETQLGDHYDPQAKAVRLLPDHYRGHSLSAVVIAAHEVGHAMQDATGYAPLSARTRMAKLAGRVSGRTVFPEKGRDDIVYEDLPQGPRHGKAHDQNHCRGQRFCRQRETGEGRPAFYIC